MALLYRQAMVRYRLLSNGVEEPWGIPVVMIYRKNYREDQKRGLK